MRTKVYFFLIIAILISSCKSISFKNLEQPELINVKNGKIYKGNKPYYYVGTNYWYGPLLASQNSKGRKRLRKELDYLIANGVDNLRVLIGADGGTNDYTVRPALQYAPGKYNDTLLDGLDYFMAELRKRKMYAILYFTNTWEWSGGMSQYLNWNGYGEIPIPNLPQYSWSDYVTYIKQFYSCENCMKQLEEHVKFIMKRTNRYTGIKYTEDNTVMSWQVANEPRIFSDTQEELFTEWLNNIVEIIDSLDSKHLISTGAEGSIGFFLDMERFKRTHDNPKIDYLTTHVWPKNWNWYNEKEEGKSLEETKIKVKEYLQNHIDLAKKVDKPIVFSEFGLPRDGECLSSKSSTKNRDNYYKMIFSMLEENKVKGGKLQGLNFWGFGGFSEPIIRTSEGKWLPGDELTSDPPQEPQGLNSVFATDLSTMQLVRETNIKVDNLQN